MDIETRNKQHDFFLSNFVHDFRNDLKNEKQESKYSCYWKLKTRNKKWKTRKWPLHVYVKLQDICILILVWWWNRSGNAEEKDYDHIQQ